MKSSVRPHQLLNLLFIIVLFIGSSCFFKSPDESKQTTTTTLPEKEIAVKITRISPQKVEKTIKTSGDVEALFDMNITTPFPGYVEKMYAQEGREVSYGQTLFEINRRDLTGMAYQNYAVTSKIAGIVVNVNVEEGELANAGVPLARVLNMDIVKVKTEILSNDISRVKEDQTVLLTTSAYSNQVFKGKLHRLSPIVNPLTRTMSAEIRFDNEKKLLKPGMFVNAEIKTGISDRAVLLPIKTIIFDDELTYIFVYDNDKGSVSRWDVLLGDIHQNMVEILRVNTPNSALPLISENPEEDKKEAIDTLNGKYLVIAGQHYLSEGDKVFVQQEVDLYSVDKGNSTEEDENAENAKEFNPFS